MELNMNDRWVIDDLNLNAVIHQQLTSLQRKYRWKGK